MSFPEPTTLAVQINIMGLGSRSVLMFWLELGRGNRFHLGSDLQNPNQMEDSLFCSRALSLYAPSDIQVLAFCSSSFCFSASCLSCFDVSSFFSSIMFSASTPTCQLIHTICTDQEHHTPSTCKMKLTQQWIPLFLCSSKLTFKKDPYPQIHRFWAFFL